MNWSNYGNNSPSNCGRTSYLLEKIESKNYLKKIYKLSKAINNNPYIGLGKPEPLKFQLSGKWSRRIDSKNRIVYLIEGDKLYIYSLKGH